MKQQLPDDWRQYVKKQMAQAMGQALAVVIGLAICLIISMCMSGCATKRKTITEESSTMVKHEMGTTIIQTHDTTKVIQRIIPIEVEIPTASRERTTKDTTSTLETDIYKSTATWSNGTLTHTLETKPGAKVKGKAEVSDTTKTYAKSEKIQKTSNDSQTLYKTQKQETRQTCWGWLLPAGIIIGIAATIAIIWLRRKQQ